MSFNAQEQNWKIVSSGQRYNMDLDKYKFVFCVCVALTNRLMRTGVQMPLRPADWSPLSIRL